MARQVLENGVILPAEYSDDWYDDMTSNLTKLDDVIGSDSEKLSSSDVGAAALSNNYNDLDNLPTIPTVNDATLTIQKNGVDVQTFTANASSNVTCNITVPTKTSDLTNDSNFVDTSNSAVASGITSAKVTDYDTHIADTDIHVTTTDKATWNTVTSKADDSDVVHKSGDETVGGIKNFTNDTYITSLNFTNEVASPSSSASSTMPIINTITYTSGDTSVVARLNFRVTADGIKSLYPHENNQYALGLTSRKWSEVHGVTYYYGSSDVEFSQKFVTTDTAQTVGGQKIFTHNATGLGRDSYHFAIIPYGKNTPPANTSYQYVFFSGNTASQGFMNSWYGGYIEQLMNPDGSARGRWFIRDTSESTVVLELFVNGSDKQVRPQFNNTTDLGTSTNKWKSFNGLEPSALGMPDLSNGIDISSYLDTSQSSSNHYTPPVNGWISIKARSGSSNGIAIIQGDFAQSSYNLIDFGTTDRVTLCALPVIAGVQVTIWLKSITTLDSAKFFPCQGNV